MKPIINLKNSWELSYDEFQKVLVFSKKDATGDEERKVSYDLEPEVWNQLSVVRESGELRFYVNGQLIESPIQDESNYGTSDKLFIGKSDEAYFEGWVEQLKVSKGLAKYLCDFTPRNLKKLSEVNPKICYRLDKNYASSGDVCTVDEVNKLRTSDPFSFTSNENFQIKANTNFNDNFTISFELSWDDAHTGTILFLGDVEKDLHILKLSVSETNSKKLKLTYVQRDASEKTFETIELVNSRFSTIKLIGNVEAQKLSLYSDGILAGEDVEYTGLVKSRDMFPDMQDILRPDQYNNPGNIIYAHGYPAPRTNYKHMYTRKFHISNFRKVFDPLYIPKYDIDPVTCEKTKERYVWGSNMKTMGGIQTVIWFKNPITIKADSEIFNYYQYTHRCIGRCGLKNVRRNIFSKTLGYGHSGHTPQRYKVRGCNYGWPYGTWRVRPQHTMSGRTTQEIKDVAYIMTRGETSNCGNMMASAMHSRLGVDGILWDNGISESSPYGQLSNFKFVIGHPLSHQPTTQEQNTFTGNIKNFYFIDGVSDVDECVVCEYQEPLATPTPTPSPTPTPVDVIFEVSEDPERIEIETYTGTHPPSGDDEMSYTFTTKNIDKITYLSGGDWDVEDWSWYDGTEWKQNTSSVIPVSHLTEVKFKLNANRPEGSHDLDMVFTGTNESTGESISHTRQLKATVTYRIPTFEVSDDSERIAIDVSYTGEHPVSDYIEYSVNGAYIDDIILSTQGSNIEDWEYTDGSDSFSDLTPSFSIKSIIENYGKIKFRLKADRPVGSHDLDITFTGINNSSGQSIPIDRKLKATITMIPVEVETIGQNTVTWEYPEDSDPKWTAKVKGKLVNDGDGVGSVKVYLGYGVNGAFNIGAFTTLVGEFNQDDEFEFEFSSQPQHRIDGMLFQYAFVALTQGGIYSPISETMYLVNNGTRLNNFNIRFDPTKPGYLKSTDISGTDLSGDFTFTWFQHLRKDEEKRRIFKTSGFGDSASAGFSLYSVNGVFRLQFSNGESSFDVINQGAYPWLFDKWVHVALEFDRQQRWVKCYIDGGYFAILAREENGFTSDVDFTSNYIEIGSSVDSDGGTYPLNGNIDNFQIYDKKLNATEIFELSDRQHNNPHKFGAKHAWLMGDGYFDKSSKLNLLTYPTPAAEGLPVHFVQDVMSVSNYNYGLTSEPETATGVTYNYAPDFETFHCIKPVLGDTIDGKQYRLVYDNDIPNSGKHIPWPSRYENESMPIFVSGTKPSIYTNGQETIIDNNVSPANISTAPHAYLIKDTKPLDFDGSYVDWVTQKFAEYKSIPKTEYYFKHDVYTGISSPYTDEVGAVSVWFQLDEHFTHDGGHFGTLMTLQSGWSLTFGSMYGQMPDTAVAMYSNGWYYGFLRSDYTPAGRTWNHLVINWNEQDKEYQFYINGNKMKTIARLKSGMASNTEKTKITSSLIHIGRRNDKNMSFGGAIADIAIYKNSITEEKALELYNNGISPADASDAEIWYRMGNDDTITHEYKVEAISSEELPLITTNSGTLGTDFNAEIEGHGPNTTREYRTVGEYSPGIHNPTASVFLNKLCGRGNIVGGECFSPLSNFISTDALWHISAEASSQGISAAGSLNGAADLTGNGNHFTNSGMISTVPGYFDSSIKVRPYYHITNGASLVLNNAIPHGSSFTFAIVLEHNSKDARRPYGSWNYTDNLRYFQIRNNESTQSVYIGKDGADMESRSENYPFPYESNTQVLEIWRYNSSNNTLTKYMYSEQDSGSVTSHEYTKGPDELHNKAIKFALGDHDSGEPSTTANIKLYEAIWFDSALFGDELNSLVTYLNDKHKVTETPQAIEINSTTADFTRKS